MNQRGMRFLERLLFERVRRIPLAESSQNQILTISLKEKMMKSW